MRISSKCSIALHILLYLAVFDNQKLTSELLAQSIGCNPVIVRNLVCALKKAGLIEVRRGAGGANLTADPKDITVWTVFCAVDPAPLEELVGLHSAPSSSCPIGKNIHTLLETPYQMVSDSVKEAMLSYTLQQLIDAYHAL